MVQPAAKTILIVEDDAGVATLENRRLTRAGYRSLIAETVDCALKTLRTDSVDLILLDYKLPGDINGLEFYDQLRRLGIDVPVILVTSCSDDTLIIKALRAGVRDYITKSKEYLDYLPEAVTRVLRQTERENRLVESEARLASVIDSAKDAILVADSRRRITLFNPAAEHMFRCTAAKAMGEPLSRFFRSDYSKHGDPVAESLTVQVSSWTLGVRADGEEFPLEASISRSTALGRSLQTVLVRDITDRRRAEAKIMDQAALLDKATDAIVVCDINDRVVFLNQAAERLSGWTSAEALGQPVRQMLFRSAGSVFDKANQALLEWGEWNGELKQSARDGGERIVDSRWTLTRDLAGTPRSKLMINTDITERKKLEAQFMRSQRLESLGTLAGGIAHDLNNMLTPIMMAVELLGRGVTDPTTQSLQAMLRTSTERGADLVRQILAFARGTPGERQLLFLHPLLNELAQLLRQTFPKSLQIDASIPPGLWSIHGNATQIHQVLLNLCVNARDAMPDGGKLTINAMNYTVDEPFARVHADAKPGPHVLLSVEDTGVGIAPAILQRIFDPFYTTKGLGQGTGLGLSTTIGIVRSHNGFIHVYSEPEKGSQFHVFLPAAQNEFQAHAPAKVGEFPTGKGELILLVDDEAAILQLGKVLLETHGYRALACNDGQEALTLFQQYRNEIRLVITDLAMPTFDGRATIRGLRALSPGIRIIVASGVMPGAQLDPDLKTVQAFLPKPYSAETLLSSVHRVLGESVHFLHDFQV